MPDARLAKARPSLPEHYQFGISPCPECGEDGGYHQLDCSILHAESQRLTALKKASRTEPVTSPVPPRS